MPVSNLKHHAHTIKGSYFIAGKAELRDIAQFGMQGRERGDFVMGEIHDPKVRQILGGREKGEGRRREGGRKEKGEKEKGGRGKGERGGEEKGEGKEDEATR